MFNAKQGWKVGLLGAIVLATVSLAMGAVQSVTTAMRERALISRGDPGRIDAVLAKARRGEPICVAAIGGSITAGGSHTKDPERRYIHQVARWFEATFPGLKVRFVNAGIGATNSGYGALRVQRDVLAHHPDLVIVEYAVNDCFPGVKMVDSYEGVLRQLLSSSTNLAVIELFFMHKDGASAQTEQVRLGQHYGLPMISFRDAFYPEYKAGRLKWEDYYDDVVHPGNAGHDIASELLRGFLAGSMAKLPAEGQPLPSVPAVPAPLITDAYERCALFRAADLQPTLAEGWVFVNSNVWECSGPEGRLDFKAPGTMILLGPEIPTGASNAVTVVVDGGSPVPIQSSGHRRPVVTNLPQGLHQVSIRVHSLAPCGTNGLGKVRLWWGGSAGLPVATPGVPAEPVQLRGLPRPNELPLAQGPFQPTKASLDELYQCPEWFADAKFGLWAHWGPQCVGMNGWYAKRLYDSTLPTYQRHLKEFGHPSKVGYKDTLPLFTAEKFDPEGLMAEFKQIGARLFLAMGVHHDNYDMWDSKYHRWNAVKIGPRKDIVKLWQDAAKKQGLRFGVSEHLAPSFDWWNPNKSSDKTGPLAGVPYDGMDPANWDLYHPPHPGDQNMQAGFSAAEIAKYPEWFKEHWYRRMYDLLTTYQPDFVDSDDFGLPWGDAYASKLAAHYYNRSAATHGGRPDVVWCGRGGNGKGVISYSEFGLPKRAWRYPWVQGNSITGWYWEGNPPPTVNAMVSMMVEVISRNGNFIISFPQLVDGTVPEDHMNCLRGIGKWVRLNEEGIFGTRPWRLLGEGPTTVPYDKPRSQEPPFTKEDIRFTRKGGTLYAFLMNPADDKVVIRSLGKRARLADGAPQAVRLLGYDGKLSWSQEEDGLKVQLPEAWIGRTVPVLEIRGFTAWDGDIRPGLDGQLVLEAIDARLNGKKLQLLFGREFVENWSDPAEWVSWDKVHLLEAGEYEVTIYGGGQRADVPYRLTIGDKELTGIAPNAGGWGKGKVFPAGKIAIEKAGVYPVALRAGSKENWGGLQIFNVTLKRMK